MLPVAQRDSMVQNALRSTEQVLVTTHGGVVQGPFTTVDAVFYVTQTRMLCFLDSSQNISTVAFGSKPPAQLGQRGPLNTFFTLGNLEFVVPSSYAARIVEASNAYHREALAKYPAWPLSTREDVEVAARAIWHGEPTTTQAQHDIGRQASDIDYSMPFNASRDALSSATWLPWRRGTQPQRSLTAAMVIGSRVRDIEAMVSSQPTSEVKVRPDTFSVSAAAILHTYAIPAVRQNLREDFDDFDACLAAALGYGVMTWDGTADPPGG